MKKAITMFLALALILMPVVSSSAYNLTDEEREILEQAVMAEASPDFYGQALIAECALNTAELNGWSIYEVLENYGWTKNRVEPSESAIWAVKAVFDYGYSPTNNQLTTIFYNANMVVSPFHESQEFVLEWRNVRFFRESKYNNYSSEVNALNNQRRAKLKELKAQLSAIEIRLEDLSSDEEDAYYNLPEGIQMSERGEKMEDAISSIDAAADYINSAIENIEAAINEIEEAIYGK